MVRNILAVSALLVVASASNVVVKRQGDLPTINTPPSVIACQPVQLSFAGTPPLIISVLPGGQISAAPLKTFPTQDAPGSLTWNADIAPGTAITLSIRDGQGRLNYAQEVTILPGTTTSCIGGSDSSSASAPASGTSASSASTRPPATTTTGAASSTTSAASSSAPATTTTARTTTPPASSVTTPPAATSTPPTGTTPPAVETTSAAGSDGGSATTVSVGAALGLAAIGVAILA